MELLTGNEQFSFDDMPSGYSLSDFWRWQSSNLLSNSLRGKLAEFVVANALCLDTSSPRDEWDSYDLLYDGMFRIEVKSSAYVQSWHSDNRANSVIQFSVRPTKAWTSKGGRSESFHQSDMYIFCVLSERVKSKANPMLLEQWEFYPVLTHELSSALGNQKTAGLNTVKRLCPIPCDYDSLHDAVRWLYSGKTDNDALQRIESRRALKGEFHGFN
jgi:hypothetical protein